MKVGKTEYRFSKVCPHCGRFEELKSKAKTWKGVYKAIEKFKVKKCKFCKKVAIKK